MISKELLSEVLGREVLKYQIAGNPNDLAIGFKDGNNYSSFDLCINIHELSYKCKEWAYKQGYFIKTGVMASELLRMPDSKEVDKCYNTNFENGKKFDPMNDILVCQWILDNKEQS